MNGAMKMAVRATLSAALLADGETDGAEAHVNAAQKAINDKKWTAAHEALKQARVGAAD
jgi:hypothetical protein